MATGRRPPEARSQGLVTAFQDLTDGLVTLVRQHLQLVRYEIKEDAVFMGRHVASIVVFATVVLVGYGLLNLSAVFFAGAAFGPLGMAIAALVLAGINLGLGGRAALEALRRLRHEEFGLRETGMEFERDKQWVKEIREIREGS